jgi:rhamnose transport system permease protein
MHAVVHTGGSLPSILFGMPGSGADAATVVDGYPMTKRGLGGEALGASFSASAVGGVVGALVLVAIMPAARVVATSLGAPEYLLISLLGLCAVLFGMMTRGGGWPIGPAAFATLGVGAAGGLLNAALITRLRIPPLIVTLGSFSLFRGLAEGITGGYQNYSNYSAAFLFLGNGRIAGVPAQLPILFVVAVLFYLLLHRTTAGRALKAANTRVTFANSPMRTNSPAP